MNDGVFASDCVTILSLVYIAWAGCNLLYHKGGRFPQCSNIGGCHLGIVHWEVSVGKVHLNLLPTP